MSTVVLLSGGQDSTTSLYWAKHRLEQCGPIHALSLFYGQRHKAELDAAREIAKLAGCHSHEVMRVDALVGGPSALTSDTPIKSDGGLPDKNVTGGLPTTFVPGRNLVFLALAAAHAARVGASSIVTGVCQTDYSGYPDCRIEFIHAMQDAIKAAWPTSMPCPIIRVPLMWMTKAQTVKLAQELPGCMDALAESITCYRGLRGGCTGFVDKGALVPPCPACELRIRGFAEAGIADPAAPGIRPLTMPGGV